MPFRRFIPGGNAAATFWLRNATRVDGTFIALTRAEVLAGEETPITGFATDATSVNLTIVVDRVGSYEPTVLVNGTFATRDAGNTTDVLNSGTFLFTITAATDAPITITVGSKNKVISVSNESPATITNLVIVNNPASSDFFPVSQTEVKAGDSIFISFDTDKDITQVIIDNAGAGASQNINIPATSSVVNLEVTCGSTLVSATERTVQVRSTTASGSTASDVALSSNTILCNNLYPTVNATFAYPATQTAIKNAESVTATLTTSDFDTILYSSPNSQLSVPSPGTDEVTKVLGRLAGDYNVTLTNFRGVGTRNANGAVTTSDFVIRIANIAAVISIAEPAVMRSGGANGSAVQNHTITLTSTQRTQIAPTLVADIGTLGTFNWSATATVYSAALALNDTDAKGTGNWSNMAATGLSGIAATLAGDTTYLCRGFVQRTITLPAFADTFIIGVAAVNLDNLVVNWAIDTSGALTRNTLDDAPNTSQYFASVAGGNTTIHLLDVSKTTATSVESTVTIEETI